MSQTMKIQPINSIVFVYGDSNAEVPAELVDPEVSLVAASADALIVCVYPEVDGETELTFGVAAEIDPGWAPGFIGIVNTPALEILIETVDRQIIVRQSVPSTRTALRIWFSHSRWPDRVLIGID